MIANIVIILVVGLVVLAGAIHIFRSIKNKETSCGCCSSCGTPGGSQRAEKSGSLTTSVEKTA